MTDAWRVHPAAIALAAAGVALVLLLTSRSGPGLSPDSIQYIAAARHLLAGDGLQTYDARPFLLWPPLFPVLLAAIGTMAGSATAAAQLINAVAFGLVILLVSAEARRSTGRSAMAILAATATALCPVLVRVFTMAWSEPVFILLALLALALLGRYLRRGATRWLIAAATAAGLAALTRYIGVAVIGVGAVALVALGPRRWPRRLADAALFGTLAIAPLCGWLGRNYLISGTLTGTRGWLSATARPPLFTSAASAFLLAAALLPALIVVPGLFRRQRWNGPPVQMAVHRLFVVAYVAALVALAYAGASNPIDYRLLAPAYPSAIVLAVVGLCDLLEGTGSRARRVTGAALVTGAAGVALIAAPRLATGVGTLLSEGAGGYANRRWPRSQLVAFVRTRATRAQVYSNAPEALYYWAGVPARTSPEKYVGFTKSISVGSIERLCDAAADGETTYLVLFDDPPYGAELYDADDLNARLELYRVMAAPDGAMYRIVGCSEP